MENLSNSQTSTEVVGEMATLPIGDRIRTLERENCPTNFPQANNFESINKYPITIHQFGPNKYDDMVSGHHTFAFWTIVIILFILTVGNLLLTFTVISVLHLGRGMNSLELVPEENSLKFYGITDLDRLYKADGIIEGFADVPVTITGENSNVQIDLLKQNGHLQNKMLMSKNGTTFNGIQQFDLKDPWTMESIFTTHKPRYNLPAGVDNLHAKSISSSRITAPIDESLTLNNTKGRLMFRGTEGVSLQAQQIIFTADQHVHLRAHNNSIILNGMKGIQLDMRAIPIVSEHGVKIDENEQYKICVCMPQGKLFRVRITPHTVHSSRGICSHFNNNPCF